ncbi:MAG: hypothetical protein P4L73_08035 [Caulobacteraceae bacterium]|nr:hypothetical protein [Caulobacteraceae bacterium]
MQTPQTEFDAGFRAGALSMLQAWRQRSGLILFAVWALLCVPFGASALIHHLNDVIFYVPLVGGTLVLAYFHSIVDHEVRVKIRRLETA